MRTIKRAGPAVRWGEPMGDSGGPETWRPIEPHPDRPAAFAGDIALVTCAFGHETRLVRSVHTVAVDGSVTPSLVCPVPGCTDHYFGRLEGWPTSDGDGA